MANSPAPPSDPLPAVEDAPGPRPPGEGPSTAARDLASAAPRVELGFALLGLVWASELFVSAFSFGPPTPPQMFAMLLGTMFRVGSLCLLGWLLARLVLSAAALLDILDGRATVLVLMRIAAVLERPATVPPATPSKADASAEPAPATAGPFAGIRHAIAQAQWDEADALLRQHLEAFPDDPEGPRLAAALEKARADAVEALQARVAAAREVNDPLRALEYRDSLTPLLDPEALRSFDGETIRWLMGLIQKRLRSGTVGVDVVELAALVADRFDHTAEGASLRAALPTLRRSVGLCARCGQPYAGIADACPACVATTSFPAFGTSPPLEPERETDGPDE